MTHINPAIPPQIVIVTIVIGFLIYQTLDFTGKVFIQGALVGMSGVALNIYQTARKTSSKLCLVEDG